MGLKIKSSTMNISSIDGSALIAVAALAYGVVMFVVLCLKKYFRENPKWDR